MNDLHDIVARVLFLRLLSNLIIKITMIFGGVLSLGLIPRKFSFLGEIIKMIIVVNSWIFKNAPYIGYI